MIKSWYYSEPNTNFRILKCYENFKEKYPAEGKQTLRRGRLVYYKRLP